MDTKEKNRSGMRRPTTQNRRSVPAASSKIKNKPTRRRRQEPIRKPTPDVVYTQPGPFNRTRFILRLATVVAVVLAILFGMSVFFKVDPDKITISGMDKYTAWEVRVASGLQGGENLLTLNEARIVAKIQNALPYVNTVRIGIKLPDTVNIEITELDVVYAIEANDGHWWLIRSDGRVVERTNESLAGERTKILGVQITEPVVGEQAVAYEPAPEVDDDGQTEIVTVLGSERLSTAITIMQYLEQYGVIGDAASVDVTDLTQIELWYGSRFQVKVGDTTNLKYKIECMTLTIKDEEMGQYATGEIDVSFTTWPDEVGFTPFSQ